MAAELMRCAVGSIVVPSASISSRCSCTTTSCSSSAPRPQRLVFVPSSTSISTSSPALSSPIVRQAAPTSLSCQSSAGDAPKATEKVKSLLCEDCEGNGAVVCSQCKGEGLNVADYFGGRYKAGTICWLCRGKKQMLCGNCNGAGFMGGFLNTQDE
ncbi:unnamed protein product [Calypogeia fissa]